MEWQNLKLVTYIFHLETGIPLRTSVEIGEMYHKLYL